MARSIGTDAAPARDRVGLPIVPDGSRRHPLLLRLPGDGAAAEGTCNNGCRVCVARPLQLDDSAFDAVVADRHVVIRHREAAMQRDLVGRVAELRERGAASIALVTNGRLLVYDKLTRALARAGLDRVIVKLFGLAAAEHDEHTRAEGSFDQALAGIAAARDVDGLDVLVAFARPFGDVTAEQRGELRERRRVFALELTEREPVQLPEPEVHSHPNEYRYDLVVLRDGVDFLHPHWTNSFFPMVHVNTGPICNIRCVYCNVHGGTDQRLYTPEYIETLIDDAVGRVLIGRGHLGVPTVEIIGGEPTMHPELPRLIRMARDKGFECVFICTNGMRLLRDGYLDELVDAGLTGVRFSFHDHRPEVANQLADVPGLGDKYIEVAKVLLARPDLHTHLFRIMLANTIDALPDYVRWVAAHNHTRRPVDLAFGMPSMRGRLFDNPHIYPPLDKLRPAIAAAMELALSLGIEPMVHHAPACLYQGDTTRAACTNVTTMQVDAMADTETVMNFEGDAVHPDGCEQCPAKSEGCAGLPRAYFDVDPVAAAAWVRPVEFPAGRYAPRK